MPLFKTIRLFWTFYRSILLASVITNTYCLLILWKYGYGSFFGLFWLKVIVLGFSFYFINSNKKREYYYYYNLGMSRFRLWSVILAVDFAVFIFLIILTHYVQ